MAERTFPLDCPMCHGTGNDQGGLPMCRICAARQQSEQGGYVTAFYELAALMGLPAQAASPETVWREQMLPRLRSALAAPAVVVSAEPVAQALAKVQPCGCVICTCEDDSQCHGCGARHCGTHAVGGFSNPVFVAPSSAEPVGFASAEALQCLLAGKYASISVYAECHDSKTSPLYATPVGPDAVDRRDAARYRWLRDPDTDLDAFAAANWWREGETGEVYAGEALDAAIDAALASTPSKGAA